MGIGVAAISANDAMAYPADSFENMAVLAKREEFSFPYLYDESQEVAKAYDAVCTPDFFGFDATGGLQYRGRLDDAGKGPKSAVTVRELVNAMQCRRNGQRPRGANAEHGMFDQVEISCQVAVFTA